MPPSSDDDKSIFSALGGLFDWVAELILEQAKQPENGSERRPDLLSLKKAKPVSSKARTKEVLENAQEIAKNLARFKQQLIQDFGAPANAFIHKSIDPMIESATHLIEELTSEEGHTADIFEQAVQSVELHSQFRDEKKLIKKMIQEAFYATMQAIEKDIQVLRHYLHHCLQEAHGEQETLQALLDTKLEPVFNELKALLESDIKTDDLREFYIWKMQTDEKRSALSELGFLTIDSALQKKPDAAFLEGAEEMPKEWHELSAIESSLIAKSKELTTLAILEERALKLFELLGNTTSFNKEIFAEIEQLLSDLKIEAESFQDSRIENNLEEDPLLEDTFQGLYESILRAEALLEERKKEMP